MVTMQDVALAAGVSQSTVSHVINGTRKIAPETLIKVTRAIEETGYVHDEVARSMRSRRTHTVGVATSAISNIYFSEVVGAIEHTATTMDQTLMLIDTHDDPPREFEAVRTFVSRRVDGVVLAPSSDPGRTLDLLHRRRVPTALLDRFVDVADGMSCDTVGVHNMEPTSQLVDMLAGAGHEDICFVVGLRGLSTSEERLAGFRVGLERNGLVERVVVEGMSSLDEAHAAVVRLLSTPTRPTALVSGNNAMTVGILRAIAECGLRVPEDISLACFDDLPLADVLSPRLTVVAQPLRELGHHAMRMLQERIDNPDLAPRRIRLEPELKVRDSVGPPAR